MSSSWQPQETSQQKRKKYMIWGGIGAALLFLIIMTVVFTTRDKGNPPSPPPPGRGGNAGGSVSPPPPSSTVNPPSSPPPSTGGDPVGPPPGAGSTPPSGSTPPPARPPTVVDIDTTLSEGLGVAWRPFSEDCDPDVLCGTASDNAAGHFELGLKLMHVFWYDKAVEELALSRKLDPTFAMGYCFEAIAHKQMVSGIQDFAAGTAVIKEIKNATGINISQLSEKEQGYLEACRALFEEVPETPPGSQSVQESRERNFLSITEAVYRANQEDSEACAMYALAQLGTVHSMKNYLTKEEKVETLRKVKTLLIGEQLEGGCIGDPEVQEHPGLLHYAVQAIEDLVALGDQDQDLQQAREYAERLGTVAYNSPMALHMDSHIAIQTGDWDEIQASNQEAVDLEYCQNLSDTPPAVASTTPADCLTAAEWSQFAQLQQCKVEDSDAMLQQVQDEGDAWSMPYKYRMFAYRTMQSRLRPYPTSLDTIDAPDEPLLGPASTADTDNWDVPPLADAEDAPMDALSEAVAIVANAYRVTTGANGVALLDALDADAATVDELVARMEGITALLDQEAERLIDLRDTYRPESEGGDGGGRGGRGTGGLGGGLGGGVQETWVTNYLDMALAQQRAIRLAFACTTGMAAASEVVGGTAEAVELVRAAEALVSDNLDLATEEAEWSADVEKLPRTATGASTPQLAALLAVVQEMAKPPATATDSAGTTLLACHAWMQYAKDAIAEEAALRDGDSAAHLPDLFPVTSHELYGQLLLTVSRAAVRLVGPATADTAEDVTISQQTPVLPLPSAQAALATNQLALCLLASPRRAGCVLGLAMAKALAPDAALEGEAANASVVDEYGAEFPVDTTDAAGLWAAVTGGPASGNAAPQGQCNGGAQALLDLFDPTDVDPIPAQL